MLIEKQNQRVVIKQTIDRFSGKVFDIYGFNCEMYSSCDGSMFTSDCEGIKPIYGEEGFSVAHTLFSHMFGKWEIGITTKHKSIVVCYQSGAIKTTHHFNTPANAEYQVTMTPCHIVLTMMKDNLVKENVIIPIKDISVLRAGVRSTFFVPTAASVTLVEAFFDKEDDKNAVNIVASYRDYLMFSNIWYFPALMTEDKMYMVSALESLMLSSNTAENSLLKGIDVADFHPWTHLIKNLEDFEVFLTVFISPYVYSVYNRKILLGDIQDTINKVKAGPVLARVFTNTSEEIAFATRSLKSYEIIQPDGNVKVAPFSPAIYPSGFRIDPTQVVFGPKPSDNTLQPSSMRIIKVQNSCDSTTVATVPMMEPTSTDPAVFDPRTNEIKLEKPEE